MYKPSYIEIWRLPPRGAYWRSASAASRCVSISVQTQQESCPSVCHDHRYKEVKKSKQISLHSAACVWTLGLTTALSIHACTVYDKTNVARSLWVRLRWSGIEAIGRKPRGSTVGIRKICLRVAWESIQRRMLEKTPCRYRPKTSLGGRLPPAIKRIAYASQLPKENLHEFSLLLFEIRVVENTRHPYGSHIFTFCKCSRVV